MPKRVLVLFAHPVPRRSRVNRRLLAAIQGVEGVHVRDLYAEYPELDIDVQHEQELLAEHDVLVWQHPFYWYSTPAILKEWQDLVLEFGWAYGPGGTALEGKSFLQVITTGGREEAYQPEGFNRYRITELLAPGGREEAYQPEGFNRYRITELLAPVHQTVRLCHMNAFPPFVVHGTHRMTEPEIEAHARDYQRVMVALTEGRLRAGAYEGRLNADVRSLLGG
jgi:glutathione-regulated potassium-efflux system ancillary protein KefG